MKNKFNPMALAVLATMAITACRNDKDEEPIPVIPNEEEVITTLELHFQSTGGSELKHFTFTDLDGDGGNVPVIVADTLSSDTIYEVGIELMNESVSPAVDITAEVAAEAEDHQFFFQVSGASATVAYADADGNGNPIGLQSTWTIVAAGGGTVITTLRHGPDKAASGVSSGDISNAGGETDIEVAFPMVIE